MPNFLQRIFGGSENVQVWDCDPLVVVHAEDGVVFAGKAQVECVPDDVSERTGHIRCLTASSNGWYPQLRFTQRIEMLQTFDVRVQQRPGLILMGEDESGEPFTWYVNGEADRFLISGPASTEGVTWDADAAARVLAIPIDRSTARTPDNRRVRIVRIDGYCPFYGITALLRYSGVQPPVVEFVESLTPDEDGRYPAIYVTAQDSDRWSGIGADGIPVTWYLDDAAEAFLP